MSNQTKYAAFDHTDLERRRKKLWNLAEGIPLTMVGGIDLKALVISGAVFLGLVALTVSLTFVPFVGLSLWSVLAYLAVAVAVYLLWPRRWGNGMTTEQNILVAADYLILQPRRIHGLAADVEPDEIHWRVIWWQPLDPRWYDELARARPTPLRREQAAGGWATGGAR